MTFKATCRMYDPRVGPRRLTQEEYKAHQEAGGLGRSSFDYGTKMWNVEVRCDFATDDVDELREHLASVHDNRKRVRDRNGHGKMVDRLDRINSAPSQPVMNPKWRGPRLKPEGKPFEPSGVELGAEVEWEEGPGEPRTGQVWSQGYAPKSVWVIPDEPRAHDHGERDDFVRHERAVLLTVGSSGLRVHETSWSQWAKREEASA